MDSSSGWRAVIYVLVYRKVSMKKRTEAFQNHAVRQLPGAELVACVRWSEAKKYEKDNRYILEVLKPRR